MGFAASATHPRPNQIRVPLGLNCSAFYAVVIVPVWQQSSSLGVSLMIVRYSSYSPCCNTDAFITVLLQGINWDRVPQIPKDKRIFEVLISAILSTICFSFTVIVVFLFILHYIKGETITIEQEQQCVIMIGHNPIAIQICFILCLITGSYMFQVFVRGPSCHIVLSKCAVKVSSNRASFVLQRPLRQSLVPKVST